MIKNTTLKVCFLFLLSTAFFVRGGSLANKNKSGLYARSIERVLRLDPDEIDLATAALIVAEKWSDVVPGRRYLLELDDMAMEIKERLEEKGLENSYKAIHVINDYLFNELGYKSVKEATDPNDLFLHSVMDKKKGYCLSLSILYLSIGERVGLPLYGVVVPGHFFVRYDNGNSVRFNIETTSQGGYADDEHYIEKFNVPKNYSDSIYMKNLDNLQILGCLFNNLGNVYSDMGNTEAALLALERAVEINPTLAESRMNLGNIYLQKDNIDDAIYEYRQALAINPDNGKTYNNLGNAYLRRGWLNDALSAYTQSIRLDSNSVDAHINTAIAYSKLKMFNKATAILRKALTIDPKNCNIYLQLGNVYNQSGDYEKAKAIYKKALRIERNNAEAHFNLAVCYGKLDQAEDEIREYKKALDIQPDMVSALINLGNSYFNKKKYNDAIEQYDKAVILKPDDSTIHYNLGSAYSNQGNYEKAVVFYKKALKLNPEMSDAHESLAFAYYKLKKYDLAWQHTQLAEQSGKEIDEALRNAIERKVRR